LAVYPLRRVEPAEGCDDGRVNSRVLDGWRLALGTLTVVDVTPPTRVDRRVAQVAALLAPIAFVPVAAAVVVAGWTALAVGLAAPISAVVMLSVQAWLTRAIHLDGLADTADGLGSGRPAAQALEIMRRGDIGPMGVVTLVLTLGVQAVCLVELAGRPWGPVLAATAFCTGRAALATASRRGIPAARSDGLGAVFASCVSAPAAAALWLAGAAALAAVSWLAGEDWWRGAVGVALAAVVVVWLVGRAVTRLGGITGDVLGAAIELASTAILIGLAL